jgi:hypothetical protein
MIQQNLNHYYVGKTPFYQVYQYGYYFLIFLDQKKENKSNAYQIINISKNSIIIKIITLLYTVNKLSCIIGGKNE